MELDHDFPVPVPVDQAWAVLLDVERVATCMPGATLDSVDGEEYAGRMRVKVGAMTITYRGTARIVSADEASRTVTLEAAAKEARGPGTASATVQARLHEEDGTTRVTVHTKLNVTGRPAQFDRDILSEAGSKIITRFAGNLAAELEAPAAAPAAAPEASATVVERPAAPAEEAVGPPEPEAAEPEAAKAEAATPATEEPAKAEPEAAAAPAEPAGATVRPFPRRDEDVFDLLEVAGPSLAKRAIPAVGGLVVLLLAIRFLLRRRRRA